MLSRPWPRRSQTAKREGHPDSTPEAGPWMFTLDIPSLMPVLQHAKSRALREELYLANIKRASSGDVDNTPIINKVRCGRVTRRRRCSPSSDP